MRLNQIKSLSYNEFIRNVDRIQRILNYHFRKKKQMNIDDFYRELNIILYGLDNCDIEDLLKLENEYKHIKDTFQMFYVDLSKPFLVIDIKYGLCIPKDFRWKDDDDYKISPIKIRILK